jgi:ribosomal protein L37E
MMAQPGDACPNCGGFLIVVNTIQSSLATIRYIGCRGCGHRPFNNKLVECKRGGMSAPRNRRRKLSSNNFRR